MSHVIDGVEVDLPLHSCLRSRRPDDEGHVQLAPFLNHDIAKDAARKLTGTGRFHKCYVEEDKFPQDD